MISKCKQEFYKIASNPVFFEKNRVFRVYLGGKLFEDFFGEPEEDSHYPEEWIASAVKANNSENYAYKKEGVSIIENTGIYWDDFSNEHKYDLFGNREDFGILIKILDSAVRLPVQTHPDRAFSKKYLDSHYGKEESWIVLDARENAKIYLGFNNKISKEDFYNAYLLSKGNCDILPSLLNEIPVKKGDVFYIPPKIVHAIGYGCLILEVQEPTDFTIQPEYACGNYILNNTEKFSGLSEEIAFDCFDYNFFGLDKIAKLKKCPLPEILSPGISFKYLIDDSDTLSFKVKSYSIKNNKLKLEKGPCVYVITQGQGFIESISYKRNLYKGNYFFMPFSANDCTISTGSSIEFVKCSI